MPLRTTAETTSSIVGESSPRLTERNMIMGKSGETSPISDRLWTVQEASEYLNVSVTTLYGWRSAGVGGPPGRRLGNKLRYRPQDVRDWVAALSTEVAG